MVTCIVLALWSWRKGIAAPFSLSLIVDKERMRLGDRKYIRPLRNLSCLVLKVHFSLLEQEEEEEN